MTRHEGPPADLIAYMNPRPSLWRGYVRGPLRETLWVSVGFVSVLTLAVAGFEIGAHLKDQAPELAYYWGNQ